MRLDLCKRRSKSFPTYVSKHVMLHLSLKLHGWNYVSASGHQPHPPPNPLRLMFLCWRENLVNAAASWRLTDTPACHKVPAHSERTSWAAYSPCKETRKYSVPIDKTARNCIWDYNDVLFFFSHCITVRLQVEIMDTTACTGLENGNCVASIKLSMLPDRLTETELRGMANHVVFKFW